MRPHAPDDVPGAVGSRTATSEDRFLTRNRDAITDYIAAARAGDGTEIETTDMKAGSASR